MKGLIIFVVCDDAQIVHRLENAAPFASDVSYSFGNAPQFTEVPRKESNDPA
jgi:hypothetical protein